MNRIRIIASALFSLLATPFFSPTSHAEIITYDHGETEHGKVIKITETGFLFEGDRNPFLRFNIISDIEVDPSATGAELERQQAVVKKVSQMLVRQTHQTASQNEKVLKHLKAKEFKQLDQLAESLLMDSPQYKAGGWRIYYFYESMDNDLPDKGLVEHQQRVDLIRQWVKERPTSQPAKIALMNMLDELAWDYRGSGYSNTISKKGRNHFHTITQEAVNIGHELLKEKPSDPMFYHYYAWLLNTSGAKKSEILALVRKAIKVNPAFYNTNVNGLTALLPKWGGSRKQTNQFHQELISTLKKENKFEVLFQVHRNFSYQIPEREYTSYQFDWNSIKQSFELYRQQFSVSDYDIHTMAKLATLSHDREAAKQYFAQAHSDWNYLSEGVWYKKESLERHKKWSESSFDPFYQQVLNALIDQSFLAFSELLRDLRFTHALMHRKDLFGDTLLHRLARSYPAEYIKSLAKTGVSLEVYNDSGYTPLQLATNLSRNRVVEVLLKHGADPAAITNYNKNTSLHIAALKGFTSTIDLLVKKDPELLHKTGNNGWSGLHIAASRGYTQTVNYFLKNAKDLINTQSKFGSTPLHMAIRSGHFDIVQQLVEGGADTSIKNDLNHTALSLAKEKNAPQITEYLQAHNAPDSSDVIDSKLHQKTNKIIKSAKPYFNSKDFPKAKKLYLQAIEVNPKSAAAHAAIAQLAMEFEKNYQLSDEYYDKAIALNPRNPENYYWKGRVNYLLNKPAVYRPLFTKYVAMAPDTYNAKDLLTNWSHLLHSNKKTDKKKHRPEQVIKGLIALLTMLLIFLLIFYMVRKKRT